MRKTAVCRHCGASEDIHRYETNQCPAGGVEVSGENYLFTTYEEDEIGPLRERVESLEAKVRELENRWEPRP